MMVLLTNKRIVEKIWFNKRWDSNFNYRIKYALEKFNKEWLSSDEVKNFKEKDRVLYNSQI